MAGLYNNTDVIELTDEDFDLSGNEPVLKGGPGLVMAYSAHCPHCISKRETYTDLARRLNNKGGYQMYAIHTANPKTNGVGRGLNVEFVPTFFEADQSGRMTSYAPENFGLEQILDRAKIYENTYKKPYVEKAKKLQGLQRGIDISKLYSQKGGARKNRKSPAHKLKGCQGITQSGYACSRKAIPGTKYCHQH